MYMYIFLLPTHRLIQEKAMNAKSDFLKYVVFVVFIMLLVSFSQNAQPFFFIITEAVSKLITNVLHFPFWVLREQLPRFALMSQLAVRWPWSTGDRVDNTCLFQQSLDTSHFPTLAGKFIQQFSCAMHHALHIYALYKSTFTLL